VLLAGAVGGGGGWFWRTAHKAVNRWAAVGVIALGRSV
jgi:hypothetical protein